MITILSALVSLLSFRVRIRASLELELVALRHQVTVLRRQHPGQLRLPARRDRSVFEQPINLTCPRLREATQLPLLHDICDAERQQFAAECSWRLFVK